MTQKKYDLTFHYFRAFAILSVMLTHMWVGPLLDDDGSSGKLLDSLRQCLFHSSTIYFIFISGYLFDHVNRRRAFRLLRFYKAKLLHVFCPYCVLSLLLLGTAWVAHNAFHIDIAFINEVRPWPRWRMCWNASAMARPAWCRTGTFPSSCRFSASAP